MDMQEAEQLVTYFNNGVYAQRPHAVYGFRWFKVYSAAPDSRRTILEAGYEMMPADYREEHDTPESALASLAEIISPDQWQEAEF
jgi:hypothetical protein